MEADTGVSSPTLTTKAHIQIAQLNPNLPDIPGSTINAIVTLIWPYSSSNETLTVLLAEPDFRLRRSRGQVRVQFQGSSARHVFKAGIGSGDEVILSLEGVEWVKDDSAVRTPGRGVEWELRFLERLVMQFTESESKKTTLVDIDHPPPEPTLEQVLTNPIPEPPSSPLLPTSSVLSRPGLINLDKNEYSSPAFVKRARLSYGALFGKGDDIFGEDDELTRGKARKRIKFGRPSGSWRYSSRSPSPDVEMENEVAEEPRPRPSKLQKPTMTDEGCQTVDSDYENAAETLAGFGGHVISTSKPVVMDSSTKSTSTYTGENAHVQDADLVSSSMVPPPKSSSGDNGLPFDSPITSLGSGFVNEPIEPKPPESGGNETQSSSVLQDGDLEGHSASVDTSESYYETGRRDTAPHDEEQDELWQSPTDAQERRYRSKAPYNYDKAIPGSSLLEDAEIETDTRHVGPYYGKEHTSADAFARMERLHEYPDLDDEPVEDVTDAESDAEWEPEHYEHGHMVQQTPRSPTSPQSSPEPQQSGDTRIEQTPRSPSGLQASLGHNGYASGQMSRSQSMPSEPIDLTSDSDEEVTNQPVARAEFDYEEESEEEPQFTEETLRLQAEVEYEDEEDDDERQSHDEDGFSDDEYDQEDENGYPYASRLEYGEPESQEEDYEEDEHFSDENQPAEQWPPVSREPIVIDLLTSDDEDEPAPAKSEEAVKEESDDDMDDEQDTDAEAADLLEPASDGDVIMEEAGTQQPGSSEDIEEASIGLSNSEVEEKITGEFDGGVSGVATSEDDQPSSDASTKAEHISENIDPSPTLQQADTLPSPEDSQIPAQLESITIQQVEEVVATYTTLEDQLDTVVAPLPQFNNDGNVTYPVLPIDEPEPIQNSDESTKFTSQEDSMSSYLDKQNGQLPTPEQTQLTTAAELPESISFTSTMQSQVYLEPDATVQEVVVDVTSNDADQASRLVSESTSPVQQQRIGAQVDGAGDEFISPIQEAAADAGSGEIGMSSQLIGKSVSPVQQQKLSAQIDGADDDFESTVQEAGASSNSGNASIPSRLVAKSVSPLRKRRVMAQVDGAADDLEPTQENASHRINTNAAIDTLQPLPLPPPSPLKSRLRSATVESDRSMSAILEMPGTPRGHDASAELAMDALESPSRQHRENLSPSKLRTFLKKPLVTDIGAYTPLKLLRFSPEKRHEVIAIATTATPDILQIKRSASRQFSVRFLVNDPSVAISDVREVNIFRGWKEALPVVEVGDCVLLRNFSVKTDKGSQGLRSENSSSWVVFKKDGREVISGPQIEFGYGEREHAEKLISWYQGLDTAELARLAKSSEIKAGGSAKAKGKGV